MRELALVLPGNVWLTNLGGDASRPDVSAGGGALGGAALDDPGAGARDGRLRPRPGRGRRLRPGAEADRRRHPGRRPGLDARLRQRQRRAARRPPRPARRKQFIAQFQIVVAFDAAPVPETASGEGGAAPAPAPEAAAEGRRRRSDDRVLRRRGRRRWDQLLQPPDRLDPGRRRRSRSASGCCCSSPKREKADELGSQVETLKVSRERSAVERRAGGSGAARIPERLPPAGGARPGGARRATKPPRCWSNSTASPNGPRSSSTRSSSKARAKPPNR